MRDKIKKLITSFLMLLFLSSFFNFSPTDIRKNENFQINTKENKPKTSKSWDLTGSPIFIDDSDPRKNWSYTASHYDWCSGSGTWIDPYVIENVTIDGQGLGSSIKIANSSAYFIIKNCTTYNSGTDTFNAGIYLFQTDNGIILENNCSYNNRYGFYLRYSSNNTLSGNIANSNSQIGFILGWGGNNTLLGNIANNNSRGFFLGWCGNNTLKGNVMNLGGIDISGSINEMTSQKIDNSNLLNNRPIYYCGNEIGLKPNDFLNAGQIILINCNDSLISGVNISNCYNGIYLDYSNNNTIEDSIVNNNIDSGIRMRNSFNINLSNNTASFNSNYGISLSCSNITLWNNSANYNQKYGIYAGGTNIFFIENEANNNNQDGIRLDGDHNTIVDNRAFNNNEDGIRLDGDHNTIVDNRAFNNNDYGIYMIGLHNNASRNLMKNCGITAAGPLSWRSTCFVDDSNTVNEKPVYFYNNEIGLNSYNFSNAGQVQLNNCSNSVISNLNISNTTIGISIFFGNNNTISGNIANNNNYFGLIFNGDNNSISGNTMNNNKDSGLNFDGNNNQLIGNMMCCNNRYGIYPMSRDFNLFVENNISKNGEIGILLSPISNDNLFYRNIFDDNGLNAEDRGVNNNWDNGIIGNYWSDYIGIDSNNDGIGDSPYNIFGTANSQDNFPILDINPPNIKINYPGSYNIFGTNAPEFNVEIIEPHIDKMWYTINNGATSIIFTSNGTINQALWDMAPEGNVTISFYANDSVGNVNFQEITVKKDVTAPIITIQSPIGEEVFGINAPDFVIEIIELNLDTVWYSLNGGTNITFTGLSGTVNQTLWDALPRGNVTIRFYANDSVGNVNFQEVTVVKEITQASPLVIPGYDLFSLLGIILAVTIIIIRKRLNHLD